jgi:pimeloyl-ACP methyl ester carboxylesterase
MSTYLLVHDAWQSAWCWHNVVSRLRQQGHTVLAPDLPSHGENLTPLSCVTLEAYVRCLSDLLDARPPEEQIILVGHGFAGMVIAQVAEERAERIGCLVYLSALLPRDGDTALHLTERDPYARWAESVRVDDLGVELLPDQAAALLFQDCEPWKQEEALAHLTAQALLPLATPVHLSKRAARVPRFYLTCRYDRLLTPLLQQQVYTAMPCERVIWLMAGHSPMLSAPDRLAARLLGIARLIQKGN